jgi:hypothetical protein
MDEPKRKAEDLLRRVFIPIEHKTSMGDTAFRTIDHEAYVRDGKTGAIRRLRTKINKKQRRKNAHA